MNKNYYGFEEVKAKYKSYRELKESTITEEEYDIFCDEIQVLPKEIVDRVLTEIQFVLLSADPEKGNPACYINLRQGIDKEKEAIIVLTPFVFAPFVHINGKEIKPNKQHILHEIAHHILGHYVYLNEKDFEEKERIAQEQVEEWIKQWIFKADE